MITRVIAVALHRRFITLALALLLIVGGIVSWHRLPIEAYPEVADIQVDVLTVWPGHAAEEVERLITIALEKELNGIAGVTFLRSISNFGISNIRAVFADGTDSYWARQQVLERITQADLPPDVKPALGPLAGAVGELYRYTLESKTMPLVELKALQDWVLEREFRKVPGVADVVSWGGGIKQYQITVDPGRLRAYNLTLKQVFDAVSSNNANAGGSYIRQGEYALMVRGIGLLRTTEDVRDVVVTAQKGTPVRVRDIGEVGIGHAIRFGILGRDHADDLVQGIVLMRRGENPDAVIQGVKRKIDELKRTLPAGVELRDYYNGKVLVDTTVHTVLTNLIEGAALVIVLLTLFLYSLRAAFIVALTIPLCLLFAFIFMDLRGIPANLLSLGAIDFGIIVDGAVIMTENIMRHLAQHKPTGPRVVREVQHAAVEVARPLTFAVLIIMTVYVPILTFQRIELGQELLAQEREDHERDGEECRGYGERDQRSTNAETNGGSVRSAQPSEERTLTLGWWPAEEVAAQDRNQRQRQDQGADHRDRDRDRHRSEQSPLDSSKPWRAPSPTSRGSPPTSLNPSRTMWMKRSLA